ncbi:hypothetical protein [Celeribacter sp. SCSIO 80788]|uniref:hypothetical protein n=1 Tax=Celeribacter sp. SCSIO 80788 TaxID=3117013 RepID=UPI003DA51903
MTFRTPQEHINATDAELHLMQALDVLRACLLAVAVMGAGLAIHFTWSGPVQDHIETRLEQEQ